MQRDGFEDGSFIYEPKHGFTGIAIMPLGNDTDADGDVLRISAIIVPPAHGTVTFSDLMIIYALLAGRSLRRCGPQDDDSSR